MARDRIGKGTGQEVPSRPLVSDATLNREVNP